MIEVGDVLTCLMTYSDIEGYTTQQLTPSCERGLAWVKERLRPGTDGADGLIASTAAAMAHYFFYFSRLTEPDKYESYTAGDMTVRRNLTKEMLYEKELKDSAVAAASTILTDGGFFCCGT